MPNSNPITFLVAGRELPASAAPATRGSAARAIEAGVYGTLKQSVQTSTSRSAAGPIAVTAVPGQDVLVLHIDRGPSLVLHPENARDLMLAQAGADRSRGAAPSDVVVPTQLQWRGLESGVPTRGAVSGFLGNVFVKAIEVFAGKVQDAAADFAASAIVRKVDAQVDEGVYALQPDALPTLKEHGKRVATIPVTDGPTLVLLHGTFSTTSGTFAKLWSEHPQRVRALFDHYRKSVFALDHATLGRSPVENALTLVDALPSGARLHLVSHSRGGLVAEVLARICAAPKAPPPGAFPGSEYAVQRAALRDLAQAVAKKNVAVDRVVRVACPARGTLLASKRLDAYISVFKWTLELAGIPVAPALVEFLGEVARRRADPSVLPGLAAQIPDSPLIRWMHSGELRLPGDLRVVAGDLEGDSVTTWLKTLLADAFYWTDNDLVVQTRSMYGGTPRESGAAFVLDQGGKVSHFSYFSNDVTAGAIVDALTQAEPRGFRTIGPLSWAGESATGTRAALVRAAKAGPERPAVFLLPGILGSNLGIKGDRIWLGWRLVSGFDRLRFAAGAIDGVEPDGPIGLVYDDLAAYLASTHEVIPFAFDWRRPMEEEAQRLAVAVNAALTAREQTKKPVRFLAHSMGGIVARAMQIVSPKTWTRMMDRDGSRCLMLGTPNGGSWAPMQVLSGDDTFGNLIVTVGAPFRSAKARQIVAEFPGLIQLQAGLLDDSLKLSTHAEWQRLADVDLARLREQSWWHRLELQLDAHTWGVPPQSVLDAAVTLRKKLDAQLSAASTVFGNRVVLVAGNAPTTPNGFELGADGLTYLDLRDGGDGRVTLNSALLPGIPTWTVDASHGDLPKRVDAFTAYAELLETGTTRRLPSLPASVVSRGAAAAQGGVVRSRPSRSRIAAAPPQQKDDVLTATPPAATTSAAPRQAALRVSVVHGNLTYVAEPIVLGHYKAATLTGTERVMDATIGGDMSAALARGLYPSGPDTHEIFVNTRERPDNPWQFPRPKAVIVVGLGEEGSLRGSDLVKGVRLAVIAWAKRLAEEQNAPELFTLAATLIGSGGAKITVTDSAQLIARGVQEANEAVASDGSRAWPRVDHLQLIELYLDRATEAWRSLQVLAAACPAAYTVTETIVPGQAGLPRVLDGGYRGASYDFISAVSDATEDGEAEIVYTLDTRRARTEVQAQKTQGPLIRKLVMSASNVTNADVRIGYTLFRLLVPSEIQAFLGGSTETVIELNSGTAGIPWELLNTEVPGRNEAQPWAVRTKLIRKLRTNVYRHDVVDSGADAAVLVIGEPQCDHTVYPALPGARREAIAVAEAFRAHEASRATAEARAARSLVKPVISPDDPNLPGPDAQTVINAVLERDWRIVHVAGHGEPPVPKGIRRGVVLSDDLFLGPNEIESMNPVPELVFVNCCHLAARNPAQVLDPSARFAEYDRSEFAAGVAEALIRIGVRCVIAAGWAVEDAPASTFATTFYQALLRGARFIDAVGEARLAAWQQGGNTWAAYQCYGDPEWVYRTGVRDAQRPPASPRDELSAIASSDALVLALQTIAIASKYENETDEDAVKRKQEQQKDRLRYLETRFGASWGPRAEVAGAFGQAWSEIGDRPRAIAWFEAARSSAKGTVALSSLEQLANLKARDAWERVERAAEGGKDVPGAASGARTSIDEATALLEKLVAITPTPERHAVLASAYKRRAMIESAASNDAAARAAIRKAVDQYREAERLATAGGASDIFYYAMNRIITERALTGKSSASHANDLASIKNSLDNKVKADPDFWSVVGQTEFKVYEALFAGTLADSRVPLAEEFIRHHARVRSPRMWASVYDNAVFALNRCAAGEAEAEAARQLLAALKKLARRDEGNAPSVTPRTRKKKAKR